MSVIKQRTVATHYNEDDATTLHTILKPASAEHNGRYIVIREDCHGDVDMFIHTPEEMKEYMTEEEIKKATEYA
jgi:hypothetical protein